MPGVNVIPQEGDFTHRLDLPREVTQSPALGFFPGSTIGNFAAPRAVALLQTIGQTLGEDAMLLIGIDRKKPVERLIRAYDDSRSEEHTSELQSLMRISYAVFCLKKKKHVH